MSVSPVIVCTGFHRSATSLMAQLLSRGGLPMGIRLMAGNISNPDGHFEDAELVELNDRLLARAGTTWQFHGEVDLSSLDASRELRDYMARRDTAHPQGWGAKDPRLCLFLPHWADLLGERARYLMVIRHWSGAIQSLLHRHSRFLAHNPRLGAATPNPHLDFWSQPGLAARMWLAHCGRLWHFAEAARDQALVVPQPVLLSGFPLSDFLNRTWGLDLAAPPESMVKPELLNDRSGESLRRLIPPSLEARMEHVWRRLLALVPGELREGVGDAALAPQWISESPQPLVRVALKRMEGEWIGRDDPAGSKSSLRPFSWSREGILERLKPGGFAARELPGVAAWIEEHAPDDPEMWQAMGLAAIEGGDLELAERALLRAIASGPGAPLLWMQLGTVHQTAGRWSRAEHHYREAIRRNPRNPAFSIALARLFQECGRVAEAAEELHRVVAAHPEPKAVAALVTVLLEAGRSPEALSAIEDLLRNAPAHQQSWHRQKARLLMSMDLQQAKELVRRDVRDLLEGVSLPGMLAGVLEKVNGKAEFEDLLQRLIDHWLEVFSGEELEAKFNSLPPAICCPLQGRPTDKKIPGNSIPSERKDSP